MTYLVPGSEFIQALKNEGLVIVSADAMLDVLEGRKLELEKESLRRQLMQRRMVTTSEIVKAGLLPLRTNKSVLDWVNNGKIKSSEVVREGKRNNVKILTSAIRRLGYYE